MMRNLLAIDAVLTLRWTAFGVLLWAALAAQAQQYVTSTIAAGASDGTNVWTRIGPDGGRVSALAVDPRNPSIVYAAGATTGEIFKTTDGGARWAALESQPSLGVGFLAIDSAGTVYVAPGQPYNAYSAGLSKSTDGGRSWTMIGRGLPQSCIAGPGTFAIDPSSPGTLYAAWSSVCKSTDGGATWTEVSSGIGTSTGFSPKVLESIPKIPRVHEQEGS